jgi:hypothetical protein
MPSVRRARGIILRLTRRRTLAVVVGLAMAIPAAWVEWTTSDVPWWASGLALVFGATGVALVWIGLTGNSPDWVE